MDASAVMCRRYGRSAPEARSDASEADLDAEARPHWGLIRLGLLVLRVRGGGIAILVERRVVHLVYPRSAAWVAYVQHVQDDAASGPSLDGQAVGQPQIEVPQRWGATGAAPRDHERGSVGTEGGAGRELVDRGPGCREEKCPPFEPEPEGVGGAHLGYVGPIIGQEAGAVGRLLRNLKRRVYPRGCETQVRRVQARVVPPCLRQHIRRPVTHPARRALGGDSERGVVRPGGGEEVEAVLAGGPMAMPEVSKPTRQAERRW